MSHFYGTISNGRGIQATKCGHKPSGLVTHAAGWNGAVRVEVSHNEATGKDEFTVTLVPWKSSGGCSHVIASGTLDATAPNIVRAAA